MSLRELLAEMGLEENVLGPEMGQDVPLLDEAIGEYNVLKQQMDAIEAQIKNCREGIKIIMQTLNLKTYDSEAGRVIYVPESSRVTYPKADLEAIAKQNSALRRILDNVAKQTTASDYVKISPAKIQSDIEG